MMDVSPVDTTTSSDQKLNTDDNLQLHQQKTQLIMSTKSITVSNSYLSYNVNLNHSLTKNDNSPIRSSPTNTQIRNDETELKNNNNDETSIKDVTASLNQSFGKKVDNGNALDSVPMAEDISSVVRETITHIIEKIARERDLEQSKVEAVEESNLNAVNSSTTNSNIIELNEEKLPEFAVSQNAPLEDLDDLESRSKDMVVLKNVEITPPPPIIEETAMDEEEVVVKNKRKKPAKSTPTSTADSGKTAGKRQRVQIQRFQAGDVSLTEEAPRVETVTTRAKTPKPLRSRKKSTTPSIPDTPEVVVNQEHSDVIFYEKNDYLAIRNEEDSFYLCQLAENVKANRPEVKVRWLDTKDSGKSYFLTSQYDKVPQKSIIMPVVLDKLKSTKKGEQTFSLDEHVKDNIVERLKRSLSIRNDGNSQEISNE